MNNTIKRVVVLSDFCLGPKVGDVFEGAVLDLPEAEADYKIRQGFCRELKPGERVEEGRVVKAPEGGGAGPHHITDEDVKNAGKPRDQRGRRR